MNNNINIFNLTTLKLFSDLYESFPIPISVDPDNLALKVIKSNSTEDGTWSAMDISSGAVSFLKEEGFISVGSCVNKGEFNDVRLTMKGLAVLGSVPISLKESEAREPVIVKIRRLIGKGTEKVAADSVQSIVSEIFKLVLSSGAVVSNSIINT